MRYAQIRKMDISNGKGIGVSLFVQGCPIHCKGCFNPETWDFNGGKQWTNKTKEEIIKILDKPYISRFSILGGEPLTRENLVELYDLVFDIKIKYPHIKIWLWTGYTWKRIWNTICKAEDDFSLTPDQITLKYLLDHIDYLIAGPFIQKEKDLTLLWRGSRNQEVIDMQATIKKGEKILYVTN